LIGVHIITEVSTLSSRSSRHILPEDRIQTPWVKHQITAKHGHEILDLLVTIDLTSSGISIIELSISLPPLTWLRESHSAVHGHHLVDRWATS